MADLSQVFTAAGSLLSTTQLKDTTLMAGGDADPNPVKLSATKALPITLPDVTFNINASAELDVTLFNQAADTDPDGVIGTSDAIVTPNNETDAYLKYAAGVTVSATADVTIPIAIIGFDEKLSVSGNAVAAYYKKHNNGDVINTSFIADIATFKTIFIAGDITSLAEGDVLTFSVNGSLTSDLKVSWSSIFSQSLNILGEYLPTPLTFDLSLSPSISVEFVVEVSDSFALVIKKLSGDQCLLSVKKTKSVSTDATASAGIDISFKDSDSAKTQLTAIYNELVHSVFGNSINDVIIALQKVKSGIADATQNGLVNILIARYNLSGVADAIDQLIAKVDAIEQYVPNLIGDVATANVKLSFSYEYKRINLEKDVLSVNIATADLLNYHDKLLRFDITQMLSDMRAGVIPYQLNTYMNQKTLTIASTWGLGLTVFSFTLLGQDIFTIENVINENFAGLQQVSTEGTQQYKWVLGNGSGSWLSQIGGQMPTYGIATLDKFDFTFLLSIALQNNNVKADDLNTYFDFAVIWDAIQQSDLTTLTSKYTTGISSILNKPVTIANKITFPPALMKLLIEKIATTGWANNIPYLTKSMSAALPYENQNGRTSATDRIAIYNQLWQFYFDNYENDPETDFAGTAKNTIQTLGSDYNDLANWEGGDWPNTWANIIKLDGNMLDALKQYIQGFINLKKSIDTQASYTAFKNIFNNELSLIGTQDFYVKTAGYFLLLHAAELDQQNKAQSVFTITVGPEGNQQTINFALLKS